MLNFEKIELLGFKSFPDKAKVEILDGITGIVGPNGCGKSNIADAVKWVLGEQSAKTLRGSSMQDVIFNGTAQRKSLSYCEVSLYFNNTNKLFPSLDYNEVVITRKLFRSGESEYMINRQPSRLKDIIQLLHECGVSKSGYSIIEQGKVQEIFNAKPEDRRAIFEEAVGIAKTKQDRKETMAKLQRTQENISRVDDIITERSRQIGPLGKQAEKARQFVKLSEDLKYHEINTYVYKYETASSTKAAIQERIDGYTEALSNYRQDMEDTINSYNSHQDELSKADETLTRLNDEITNKAVASEKKTGEANVYTERLNLFKNENKRLLTENETGENRKKELDENISTLIDNVKKYNDDINALNSQSAEINSKITKLNAKIAEEEGSEADVSNEVIKSVESLADSNKNIGALTSEKSVLEARLEELKSSGSKATEKQQNDSKAYQELVLSVSRLEDEIKELNKKIEETENRVSKANEGESAIAKRINQVNQIIAAEEERYKYLEQVKNNFDGYNGAVKFVMNETKTNSELRSKVKGVVANLITTSKDYEIAIETAIGGALQNIVVDTSIDAEYVIKYLKKAEGGRVTILPIKSLKIKDEANELFKAKNEKGSYGLARQLVKCDSYYDDVVSYLLGNTLIVDDITNARTIADKYNYAFKIVTLDGDIVQTSGAMSGGSKKSSEASLMSIERKVEELRDSLNKHRDEIVDLQSRQNQLLDISNKGVEALEEYNSQVAEKQNAKSELSGRLTMSKQLLDQNDEGSSQISDEITKITLRLEKIEKEFIAISQGNSELEKAKAESKAKQEEQREKNKSLRSKRDELIAELSKNDIERTNLEGNIKSSNEEKERCSKEIDDIDNQTQKNLTTIDSNKKIIEEIITEIEKNTLSESEKKELEKLKNDRDDFNKRKAQLNDLISKDNYRRDMLQSEIDKNTEKKNNEEIRLTSVDSDLEHMSENIFKNYQLDYNSCVPLKDENYDFANSIAQVDDITNQIRRLGNINPNAIEEFAELEKSYNEIVAQRDDLVKGQENLQQVINDLTKEMALTFDEKFEVIRENFSVIFKELFGGGKADLVIEESQTGDPLDAGIEIIACPPGKKLQKISLLSGGEKSLTAIAILFSILKLRPMPFVIVDEIEAALDDSNVDRFASYLKNFSKETQFICITHKKVTMEHADGLFGVTMPEKGVSSIVSVKLSDAVKIEGVD